MSEATITRAETRIRITEAAADLLRDHGPGAVTTRRVAEAAGVQAPTIYRLFGDKDGLMEAVAEYVLATYVSAKTAVLHAATAADVDPVDELRAGWDTQIDFGVANPSLFGFLNDPARGMRSPAVASGLRVLEARVHRVALTGRLRVSEQRAIDLIRAAGTGTVTAILSTPVDQRDPGLADAMLDAVLGQMLTDTPVIGAGFDVTAATVAFRAVATDLPGLSETECQLLVEWLDRAIVTPA